MFVNSLCKLNVIRIDKVKGQVEDKQRGARKVIEKSRMLPGQLKFKFSNTD